VICVKIILVNRKNIWSITPPHHISHFFLARAITQSTVLVHNQPTKKMLTYLFSLLAGAAAIFLEGSVPFYSVPPVPAKDLTQGQHVMLSETKSMGLPCKITDIKQSFNTEGKSVVGEI